MPTYSYRCDANDREVEVLHGIRETIQTWAGLCALAGIDPGDTPAETPVRRLVSAPNLSFPKTNSELKNMGFTKLVRKEKGVYENVTRDQSESRYVRADDPKTLPNLKGKIRD